MSYTRNAIMTTPRKSKNLRQPTHQTANSCSFSFVDGAFVVIIGDVKEEYLVQFIDSRYNKVIHQTQIQNNCWARTARQYFTPGQLRFTGQRISNYCLPITIIVSNNGFILPWNQKRWEIPWRGYIQLKNSGLSTAAK